MIISSGHPFAIVLTDASVLDVLANAALEEAAAAVAAEDAVVLPIGLVAAHLTQHRNRKCTAHFQEKDC